jgi:hypothetical protein
MTPRKGKMLRWALSLTEPKEDVVTLLKPIFRTWGDTRDYHRSVTCSLGAAPHQPACAGVPGGRDAHSR